MLSKSLISTMYFKSMLVDQDFKPNKVDYTDDVDLDDQKVIIDELSEPMGFDEFNRILDEIIMTQNEA